MKPLKVNYGRQIPEYTRRMARFRTSVLTNAAVHYMVVYFIHKLPKALSRNFYSLKMLGPRQSIMRATVNMGNFL